MKIYLDMDDTLTAFRQHAIARGVPAWQGSWYTTDPSTWTKEQHDIQAATNDQMRTEDFWASMPVNEGGFDLIAAAFDKVGVRNTYLLTALPHFTLKEPHIAHRIRFAKRRYAENVLSIMVTQIIVCPRAEKVKHAYHPYHGQNVLVDDAEQNVREWIDNNGVAHHYTNMPEAISFIKGF